MSPLKPAFNICPLSRPLIITKCRFLESVNEYKWEPGYSESPEVSSTNPATPLWRKTTKGFVGLEVRTYKASSFDGSNAKWTSTGVSTLIDLKRTKTL